MSIVLYATESLSLETIASALAGEGLEVRAIDANAIRSITIFGPEITKGILIVPKHGAGDPTAWFSRMLTGERQLILCSHQPENQGYEKLRSVGATIIITPRSWAPEHVSERILGQLIQDGEVTPSACGSLRGATRVMREAYTEMSIIAPLSDPVLIIGETGTGKELFAKEIHKLSQRPDKFVTINCGELSKELAGSDLFGHKKGAFTGATDARRGLLSEAESGTVFLDEIGELDLKAQAILLRVLEEKKARRVGSNQTEDLPARIVLATNRDLDVECEAGRFRHDLFERIRGFTLELSPLRKRRADIPLLAEHFLAEFNQETGKTIAIPPGALDCLFHHDWPGNVRELRAAIRRSAAFADAKGFMNAWQLLQTTRRGSKRKQIGDLTLTENGKFFLTFDPRVDTWKKFSERAHAVYFQSVLNVAGGKRKEARRLSGLGSSQFYENLKSISQLGEAATDEDLNEL